MANSVTARFNDDCKVHVAMSDDTTVTKAVIIDADGNETDIGGGGGESDFSIAKVTFVGATEVKYITFSSAIATDFIDPDYPEDNDSYSTFYITVEENMSVNVILYKGKAFAMIVPGLPEYSISTSGDIEELPVESWYNITGNCTVSIS